MLFMETVAVYCENHTEHTVWAESSLGMLIQVVHVGTMGFKGLNFGAV
jgi:hypothetical protein